VKRKPIRVVLPEDLEEKLRAHLKRPYGDLSFIVRTALIRYFKEKEKDEKRTNEGRSEKNL